MPLASPATAKAADATAGNMTRRTLLVAGIVSSALYIGSDILATNLYPGFDPVSQAVSELFAIGAPTSALVVPLFTLSSLSLLAFALGIWLSSYAHERALRVMSAATAASAMVALVLWNAFPMHMRGVEPTSTDTMHGILATNPFVWVVIASGAVAFKGWFRAYTTATILMIVALAIVAFSYAPDILASRPTPFLGLTERASQYAYDIWQVALAVVLLRRLKKRA